MKGRFFLMHATYAFLINLETARADEDTVACEAKGIFERDYVSSYCDENNWYQEEAVVIRDGRIVNLCSEKDWRKRDALFREFTEIPQEQRWDYARLVALQCVS